ncbi:alpha-(1-_6)-mannopyranosyltransferase A [Nocardia puris]|uniref:Alpha-(1->6)-mannopyranosyltransferase A n=2 Tax=Nocardia puris TaxID=208602 RepID=A0A366DLM6_9NOCA|nr:alpha-(1->6)-mannopyranosyltransferase A [Nocardia puris]MBF6367958.1 alpha-(1->6)-mannopyranosyltransferase A [Nocardia puris]MBF6462591.1 alpha-(1->6)-mannopyranosyltransferase A [Nocardia puris]RBO90214.1 alpha-1,6-mannosyltransferase [Nocardia puris]
MHPPETSAAVTPAHSTAHGTRRPDDLRSTGEGLLTRMQPYADFARSPEGHAALLGFLGALMITVGGLGAGSVRKRDPLLEALNLSWLRFGHGYALSTIVIWIGVLLMITAWVRLGRTTLGLGNRAGADVTPNELRAIVGIWVFPLLFAVPMFSRDVYSYLAQGALLRDGFDPYVVGPVANPGVLLDNVSPVWTTTTAPYGPAFLLLGRAITEITGDNVVAGTIAMRLVMLPGLALMLWAVPYLTKHLGGKPTVALWLAVLNPLVLIHLIGGVHNELLMVGLMCAGIALVLERHHVAGIVVVAIGVAIKATAGIALPFLVWIWMLHERERRAAQRAAVDPEATAEPGQPDAAKAGPDMPHPAATFAKIAGLGLSVFAAVFVAASALAGVGIGWLTALSGSKKIINWLSLPTIMAHATTWITPLRQDPVLDVTRALCALALVVVLVWTWWRFRHSEREAVLGIIIAFVAIIILSPAALPWYYSWPLALAAGFALSTTTLMVLVGLCTWLMLVFQPDGSIGLYNFWHVAAATFAAVVAALSLRKVDPLRLRATQPAEAPPSAQPAQPASP